MGAQRRRVVNGELGGDALIVLLALVAAAALAVILWALGNGVPPMPSSRRVRVALTALLEKLCLPQHPTVVDLGSGWGGVSLAVSRAMPSATGYENSPAPYLFALAARGRVPHRGNRWPRKYRGVARRGRVARRPIHP